MLPIQAFSYGGHMFKRSKWAVGIAAAAVVIGLGGVPGRALAEETLGIDAVEVSAGLPESGTEAGNPRDATKLDGSEGDADFADIDGNHEIDDGQETPPSENDSNADDSKKDGQATLTPQPEPSDEGKDESAGSSDKDEILDASTGATDQGEPKQEADSSADAKEGADSVPADKEKQLEDGTYSIGSALASGKVIDAQNGSTANGTPAQSWVANGTDAQVWRTKKTSDGYTVIYHAASGKVLDVAGANAYNGAKVQLWDYNGTMAQKWLFVADGDFFKIVSAVNRGLVLDLQWGSTSNGALIQLYTDNGTKAQRWKFAAAKTSRQRIDELAAANAGTLADGTYTLGSLLASDKVIDARNGSTADGTVAQIFSGNKTDAQVWTMKHDGKGYITLVHTASGKVLDVTSGRASNGTALQLWSSNGTWAQKWIAVKSGAGFKLLSALNTGLAADVMWGSKANGTALQLYADNGTAAQRWSVSEATTVRMRLDALAKANADALKDGVYGIRSDLLAALVLDARDGGVNDGTIVQTYKANDTVAQQWRVSHDKNGYLTILSVKSGKALDVRNGSATNGATVQLWSANGTWAQKWIAVESNGRYRLYSALAEGLVVDVPGASMLRSTGMQLYSANGSAAQAWYFSAVKNGSVGVNADCNGNAVVPIGVGFGDKVITLPSYATGSSTGISFSHDVYAGPNRTLVAADARTTVKECLGHSLTGNTSFCVYDEAGNELSRIFVMRSANLSSVFIKSSDPAGHGRKWVESSKDHSNSADGLVSVIAADGSVIYDGGLEQVRGRGNGSWGSAKKKAFQIKLSKKADLLQTGNKDNKAKTWTLITDDWDNSHSRNNIAYSLARLMGVSSAVDSDYVDFYYDGEYRGTYLLVEKVQVNKGRVDVNDLEKQNQATGNSNLVVGRNAYGIEMRYDRNTKGPGDVTGGYLIEHEWSQKRYEPEATWFAVWTGVEWQHFVCQSPDPWSYEEANYMSCLLQDLFDAFNNGGVVPTWRGSSRAWKRTSDLLDVDSLARLYWLNEITKNGDGFRFSSTYLYKDRGEGSKIKFGPAWDFDLSLGTKQSLITDGSLEDPNGWWTRESGLPLGFFNDPTVVDAINRSKSQMISITRKYLNGGTLNSQTNRVSASLAMNSVKWGATDENAYTVKDWLNRRLDWIERN